MKKKIIYKIPIHHELSIAHDMACCDVMPIHNFDIYFLLSLSLYNYFDIYFLLLSLLLFPPIIILSLILEKINYMLVCSSFNYKYIVFWLERFASAIIFFSRFPLLLNMLLMNIL